MGDSTTRWPTHRSPPTRAFDPPDGDGWSAALGSVGEADRDEHLAGRRGEAGEYLPQRSGELPGRLRPADRRQRECPPVRVASDDIATAFGHGDLASVG